MKIIITEEEKRHILGLYEQNGRGVKQKISNTKNLLLEEGETVSIINNGKKLYGTCTEGNCKDGFGRATFQNGSKYSGNWVNGNRTYGTFLDKEEGGKTYTGTWSNGLKNGSFTETDYYGMKDFGKYKNNKKQGTWYRTGRDQYNTVTTYENGVLVNQRNEDGSKISVDKDGKKYEVDSDGNKTSVDKDGNLYSVNKDGTNEQDQTCINKIKPPYNNAVTWWKNKMDEPAFYNKLKKLNEYTDQQTKEWINKYKSYMRTGITGPFCPRKNSELLKKVNIEMGTTWSGAKMGPAGNNKIFYNIKYISESPNEIEATFVHEIQHALYDLKPMTPNVNWEKVFPYKVWADYEEKTQSKVMYSQEKSTILKYGLKDERKYSMEWWKEELKDETDIGYVCRITELASRVVKMKKLLNYKTNQKITVDDFKKFIENETAPYNDSNAYFIVLCWVNNGMEDIQTFIDNLDKYVVAQAEPKKDDNIKDPTT